MTQPGGPFWVAGPGRLSRQGFNVNGITMRKAWIWPILGLAVAALAAPASGVAEPATGFLVAQDHGGGRGGGGHGGGGSRGGGHTDGHTDSHTDEGHEEGGHDASSGQRGRRFGSHGGSRGPGHLDRGGPSPGHTVEDRVFHRPDSDVEEHGHTDHEDGEEHEEGMGGPRG